VYKINQELASELDETVGQIEEEHEVVKQKIEEAGTHEEIIDIANDIISDFNGVSDHSSGKQ
jgi:cell division protein FtsL